MAEAGMAPGDGEAPVLVLGPLLRYLDEAAATIWVETSRTCRVEVLGHAAATFAVAGHHYGLVVITGLRPGTEYAYEVVLDGTVRWPAQDPAFAPSVLRTPGQGRSQRLVFGSCRRAELPPARDHAADALAALAHGLARSPRESWPDGLLLIGAIRRRRQDMRSPTSRNTALCTARRGANPRCAGCCPSSPRS